MENVDNAKLSCLKESIMKCFRKSGKEHLLITGSKKAGKTSVLNEILKDMPYYGGIKTYAIRDEKVPPRYVMLHDINDAKVSGVIAVRNRDGSALLPLTETFEYLGTEILYRYIDSDVENIIIDEIGFLENKAYQYQNTVFECLEKKRVMIVLRKESTPFIEKIKGHKDVYLLDLDNITEKSGNIILQHTGYYF